MKQASTLAFVAFFSALSSIYLPVRANSADLTPNPESKGQILTSYPVTNESVEAGLREVREALRTSPEFQTRDAPTHLRLAKLLNHQGDPNGAIEEYQAAITLNPSLTEAYRELGAVFIDKHEWRKAEQALRKGTELKPDDSQALYWLGRSLIAQEHYHLAQEALVAATKFDSTNPEYFSDLGLALMAQGHSKEAEQALKQAIALQPDFAEAHHRLEQVHAAQDNSTQLVQSAQQTLQTLFRRE